MCVSCFQGDTKSKMKKKECLSCGCALPKDSVPLFCKACSNKHFKKLVRRLGGDEIEYYDRCM